jgi:hypothetical protein
MAMPVRLGKNAKPETFELGNLCACQNGKKGFVLFRERLNALRSSLEI